MYSPTFAATSAPSMLKCPDYRIREWDMKRILSRHQWVISQIQHAILHVLLQNHREHFRNSDTIHGHFLKATCYIRSSFVESPVVDGQKIYRGKGRGFKGVGCDMPVVVLVAGRSDGGCQAETIKRNPPSSLMSYSLPLLPAHNLLSFLRHSIR